MKKYMMLFSAAAILGFTSCSRDYLETQPQAETATSTILSSTDNAALSINGICRLMTHQYLGSQGFNGEGTIKNWYGSYPGNDTQKSNLTGWSSIINGTYHANKTSSYLYYPWFYYYKLISNANAIIVNIDKMTGSDADKAFIKAQALTFRAYSFEQLAQLYCYRWSDSSNGATDGLVLRLDDSTGDFPLSTLGETYQQIYTDLNDAISLYTQSGKDRGSDEFYKPNINVAYAVYARAAQNREDWSNAAKYAALAREGYPLMSNEEYADGMHTPNSEWIWGVYEGEEQTLYYYSYFAYCGSNSSASICRNYPFAISKELIDQIPETDVRRGLYLIPTAEEYAECNAAGRSTKKLQTRAKKEFADYLYGTSAIYAYMQFKQRAAFMPGGGSFSTFRSADMYYIEAEANCHLGNDAAAQQLLFEANTARDPQLTKSTKTGDDLLAEIRLYRRFDLWGEGYDWFDYKRWGLPIVRHGKADGGNWHSTFAKTIQPDAENKWTWMLPNRETDYNKAIGTLPEPTE